MTACSGVTAYNNEGMLEQKTSPDSSTEEKIMSDQASLLFAGAGEPLSECPGEAATHVKGGI